MRPQAKSIRLLLFLIPTTFAIHLPDVLPRLQQIEQTLPNLFQLAPQEDGVASPLEYHQCPVDLPLSCNNDTDVGDSCCFEYPGGVLLSTQFWDYYPPIGADDQWTLHGLWSDLCNGQYEQFCDNSMTIDDPEQILKDFGETKLLEKMKRIWKNFNGNDASLWMHEFNKHGTCMSTIKPHCYDQSTYKENQNVVDFFKKVVEIYEGLPTYKWLSENGIVPSEAQTYTKKQIEDTLTARFGQPAFIKCNKYNGLQEVWYFHNLRGSVLSGEYYPIPAMLNSQCPETGIKWFPKNFKAPAPTHTGPPGSKPTDGTLRGFLKPEGEKGCLISNGHWYSSGTCATFFLSKAPFGGYNLRSSKGNCGIGADGYLVCGKGVQNVQFAYDKIKSELTYGGIYRWTASERPVGWKQVPVKPGYGDLEFKLNVELH